MLTSDRVRGTVGHGRTRDHKLVTILYMRMSITQDFLLIQPVTGLVKPQVKKFYLVIYSLHSAITTLVRIVFI